MIKSLFLRLLFVHNFNFNRTILFEALLSNTGCAKQFILALKMGKKPLFEPATKWLGINVKKLSCSMSILSLI